MVLEEDMVMEIARIGDLRSPSEACGLLLPTPVNGVQIIELPNRSMTPQDDFEMRGTDMLMALEQVFQGDFPEQLIDSLTAWHTHPGGNLGPSRFDMKNRPARLKSLVVTLYPDRPPQATWF